MPHVYCQVSVDKCRKQATFTWAEGSASFDPYSITGMSFQGFSKLARDAREKLRQLVEDYQRNGLLNPRAPDGDIAGPAEVIDRLEEQIERFGITVVEQSPISRDLPGGRRIEGLDLRGRGAKGLGEVWLRGVLSNGDIYVLAAWKMSGGLWDDPEYQVFFDSFIPGTE